VLLKLIGAAVRAGYLNLDTKEEGDLYLELKVLLKGRTSKQVMPIVLTTKYNRRNKAIEEIS
jgi:hypothetical protein